MKTPKTPICDFVQKYCESNSLRMHMPGHKGIPLLGMEKYDITEIDGADSLYCACGIIKESESFATEIFGTRKTLFSTEGSSLCIRAMLYLAKVHAIKTGKKPLILAARNAHKTFITGLGLLDMDVAWISPEANSTYLTSPLTDMKQLESDIEKYSPVAVYITSPDYLGNTLNIEKISEICHIHETLLIVDNAHGAYLKFLNKSRHPIDCGADMCCDSAHKTLPALTGSAYLHLSKNLPEYLVEMGKDAMSLFSSTSPSYLILQSLDRVNLYLYNGYKEKLNDFINFANKKRHYLQTKGYIFVGNEPLKWTLETKKQGYYGTDFAKELKERNVTVEFKDPDYIVMMLSAEAGKSTVSELCEKIEDIKIKQPIESSTEKLHIPKKAMKISEVLCLPGEIIPVEKANGKILANLNISCPPAVPIAVCGEVIDEKVIEAFKYYDIKTCRVVR